MESPNPNDIARDIESGVAEGRYKDCSHLCISQGLSSMGGSYSTHCRRDAFENSRRTGSVLEVGRLWCPPDCHFFDSRLECRLRELEQEQARRRSDKARERKQALSDMVTFVSAPFRWFGTLHWVTQVLIILMAILLFAPKWVPVILELLREVRAAAG